MVSLPIANQVWPDLDFRGPLVSSECGCFHGHTTCRQLLRRRCVQRSALIFWSSRVLGGQVGILNVPHSFQSIAPLAKSCTLQTRRRGLIPGGREWETLLYSFFNETKQSIPPPIFSCLSYLQHRCIIRKKILLFLIVNMPAVYLHPRKISSVRLISAPARIPLHFSEVWGNKL